MSQMPALVGQGFYFEDLAVGKRFRSHRRTLREADLGAFVNLTWLTEELFTVDDDSERALKGKVVPGAMVYAFAEGLLLPSMQDTGLAFLGATLEVKRSTLVGDTIHVEAEVTEHRLTSKGDRGLVRFVNRVVNQQAGHVLVRSREARHGQDALQILQLEPRHLLAGVASLPDLQNP